jgi:hypothetical protein
MSTFESALYIWRNISSAMCESYISHSSVVEDGAQAVKMVPSNARQMRLMSQCLWVYKLFCCSIFCAYTVNRHCSIPHEMHTNAHWHKYPIFTIYRLGNLSTYSQTTPTFFTWLYAYNHALQFTFSLLTGGPSTSATLDPITQPVTALHALHYFRLHCTRRMSIDTD